MGGCQLGLPRGALDGGSGRVDLPHQRIGERDRRKFALRAADLGESRVDLGQPAGKPLGLIAIGLPIDGATGRLDASLARLHGGARLFGGRLCGLLHLGGCQLVLVCLRGGLLQLGHCGGALRDIGLQTTPLCQCRDGRLERGACGCGDDLGLFELLGQRGYLFCRGSRCRQSCGGVGPLGGEALELSGHRRVCCGRHRRPRRPRRHTAPPRRRRRASVCSRWPTRRWGGRWA